MRRGVVVLAGLVAAGCSKLLSYDDYHARPETPDSSIGTLDSGTSEAAVDAADGGETPLRVPARPAAAKTPSGKGKTLWVAVRRFKLGSVDLSGGVPNEEYWRTLGYDLDGVCTTLEDSNLNIGTCLRPAKASKDSLVDGIACRDNNFGRHVGSLLRGAAPLAEPGLNDAVDRGSRTWILRIDDVDVGDDGYAPGRLYDARDERTTGVSIKWDGNDVRTALDDSVIGGDIDEPITIFPNGYITGDTWVSDDPKKLDLIMPISGEYVVPVHLVHGGFALELDEERITGHSGSLFGVLPAARIEDLLRPVASFGGFCPGTPIYEAALAAANKGLDVSIDSPTLQDITKTCDGLSFAVGIDVKPIQAVTAVDTAPAPIDPCGGDAGTDAAATTDAKDAAPGG